MTQKYRNYLMLCDDTAIPDKYYKIIWADQGCIDGTDYCRQHHIPYDILPGCWNTNEDIQVSSVYIKKVKKYVLQYAVSILNQYNHTDYCAEEWNIMLSYWMDMYITQFYDKYQRLKKANAYGEDMECGIYDISDISIPLDYTDYLLLGCNSENFHRYQYSQLLSIMHQLKHIHIIKKESYKRSEIEIPKRTLGYYKTDIYKFITEAYRTLTNTQARVVLQESYLPNDFLLDVMKKNPGKISNYIVDYHRHEKVKLKKKADTAWRIKEEKIHAEDEFVRIIIRLLKRNLPLAYAEDFHQLKKRAAQLYRHAKKPNAVIYACGGTAYDEIFKTYLMMLKRKGKTQFYDVQHGGNYGIDKNHILTNELEISDYLYTWGWEIQKGFPCKCRPMPAAKLVNDRLRTVRRGNRILYISYSFSRHVVNLIRENIFYKQQKEAEIAFLGSLSNAVKEKLLIRLYETEFGWHIRRDIEEQVPGLQYDQETDFYKSLNQAHLVILMEWSTTILEALFTNKPVVVLRREGFTQPQAEKDLQALQDAGILVTDWQTLRERTEEVSRDIDAWWNDPGRQAVVRRIRHKYTYMPPDYKQVWLDELIRISKN